MKWIFNCPLAFLALAAMVQADPEASAAAWTPGAGFHADIGDFTLEDPAVTRDGATALETGFGAIHGYRLGPATDFGSATAGPATAYAMPARLDDGLFRDDRIRLRLNIVYPSVQIDRSAPSYYPPKLGIGFRYHPD
ncbi:hypothetical protein E4634_18065 [Mangrovimicrobium sediminis]|uniref:Uncharacterized protein n=1 Tax=Mangrovimicrobium sediminis TaxID=2562682 RepID=A0A4Z0LW52_9GAMM|nr:hypothetical protein [Haliea sp. SAOS-164]TGD71552.1 hypothetical protein E4634_18065 [Haliea sp. SAOS-164]